LRDLETGNIQNASGTMKGVKSITGRSHQKRLERPWSLRALTTRLSVKVELLSTFEAHDAQEAQEAHEAHNAPLITLIRLIGSSFH